MQEFYDKLVQILSETFKGYRKYIAIGVAAILIGFYLKSDPSVEGSGDNKVNTEDTINIDKVKTDSITLKITEDTVR